MSEARHCPSCGYDMRGTEGDRCSECGAAMLVPLGDFMHRDIMRRAAELLEEASIEIEITTHGGQLLGLPGSIGVEKTTIWVAGPDLERAQEALRELE